MDKEKANEIAQMFRDIIAEYNQEFERIQHASKGMQYLFYSREVLITDYGADYVKQCILRYEEIRRELKAFTRPESLLDIVALWVLRVEEASLKRFVYSKYYI